MRTILILGLARSGTSLLMQMLEAGGYPCFGEGPGFEPCMPDDIPWNEVKGKAVKVLDPQYGKFPPKGAVSYTHLTLPTILRV